MQLVSMAVPIGGTSALDDRLQSLWNVNFPQAGKCIRANDASIAGFKTTIALMGLQADQCLISIDSDLLADHQAFAHLKTALAETAYITDQSDSLAVLDLQGSLAQPALERICMLDLSLFDSSTVARTVMEHLSVVIEIPSSQHARLYSPRSSAKSFLHAIQTSLSNVSSQST